MPELTDHQRDLVTSRLPLAWFLARKTYGRRREGRLPLEDMEQESVLALCQAARSWSGQGDFGSYAAAACRHALGAQARRELRSLPATSRVDDVRPDPDDLLLRCQAQLDAPGLLARLDAVDQDIAQQWLAGRRRIEIARGYGCTRQNIDACLKRIARQLA